MTGSVDYERPDRPAPLITRQIAKGLHVICDIPQSAIRRGVDVSIAGAMSPLSLPVRWLRWGTPARRPSPKLWET